MANIEPRKGSRVPVGIWSITQGDERNLDRYEGYPWLYEKHEFRVKLPDLRTVSAIAYIMTPGRRWATPSPYYLHTIKQGYEDFGFDRRNLLYAARTPVKGGVGMTRSWTPEEIQKVIEAMKAAGHMGYEEFCADFDEQMAKAALERFASVQRDHRFACPRCGKWTMSERVTTNALSRHAEVYICDQCGTEEAVLDYLGKSLPLTKWCFITDVRDAFTE